MKCTTKATPGGTKNTKFFFSTVESLFGVGILVFGTPTLLLLGYTFVDTILLMRSC